jgi:LruC domain-containing protein
MRRLAAQFALISAFASAPLAARAQDSDGDGAPDVQDAFPCDPAAAALAFAPAEGAVGLLLFEDQWPQRGDFDFNDVVLGYNYALQQDGAGRTVALRLTLHALALGGVFDNGLALHLPVPAAQVAAVTRSVDGGPAQALAVRPADQELVVVVSSDLRELFGGQAGQINAVTGGVTQVGGAIEVDVQLAAPTALPAGQAPYDLFIFRAQDPSLEVHASAYPGTAAMQVGLLGTHADRSTPGRWFVDPAGVPFVLAVPDLSAYPEEGVDIGLLYPDLLAFAASGGATHQDFYASTVVSAAAFGGARPAAPAVQAFDASTACIPPEAPLNGVVASVSHVATNGEGDRDGNGFPPGNMFDGNLNTRARFRTGGSRGFVITIDLTAPRTVSALQLYVPAGLNAGYGGLRISTDTGAGFVTQYTDLRLHGVAGRWASSESLGGVLYSGGTVGLQGWVEHRLPAPVAGVRRLRLETGWNDEASDACYSLNELVILGL